MEQDHGRRSWRRTLLFGLALGAGIGLALGAAGPAAAGPGGLHLETKAANPRAAGACFAVARDAAKACHNSADDDYWIAVSQCDNRPPSARKGSGCVKDAQGERKEALGLCAEQTRARNDLCRELGGGPYAPNLDPEAFRSDGVVDNPLSPLVPGTVFHYETQTSEGVEDDDITVTDQPREILGVPCVAVRDTVSLNGEVSEDTIDWFAQDLAGNVWYFGEATQQLEDGIIVGIEGSWMAGVDGALPGIVMEANPKPGDVYRQEFLTGDAEDAAKVIATGVPVSVPWVTSDAALETLEFSPLEPDSAEQKFYVPNVGYVESIDLETGEVQKLISVTGP